MPHVETDQVPSVVLAYTKALRSGVRDAETSDWFHITKPIRQSSGYETDFETTCSHCNVKQNVPLQNVELPMEKNAVHLILLGQCPICNTIHCVY